MEVAEQLASMIEAERLSDLLALHEDLHLAALQDGVVDLLTLLGAYVADVLRNHFRGVEHVIAEH
ncbi:hypothetical protein D3C78_1661620 [compost metagenome]